MESNHTQLFERLFEEGFSAMCLATESGIVMQTNQAFEALFAVRPGASSQVSVFQLIGAIDPPSHSFEGPMEKGEVMVFTKNAGNRKIEFTRKSIILENQRYVLYAFFDTSEKDQTAKKLGITIQQLSQALQASRLGIWNFDLLTGLWELNEAVEGIFESSLNGGQTNLAEMQSKIHPEDLPHVNEAWEKAKELGIEVEVHYRLLFENGRIKYLHSLGKPIRDERGHFVRFLGTIRDYTGEKENALKLEAEKEKLSELSNELRISKEQLLSLINNFSEVSIWSVDLQFNLIAYNEFFRKQFKAFFEADVYPGYPLTESPRMPENVREYWRSSYRRAFEGENFKVEYTLGGRFFEVSFNPIYMNTAVTGVSVFGRETTVEKKAAEELALSKERWQFSLEANQYGMWDFDLEDQVLQFSPLWISRLGYDPAHAEPVFWRSAIHPSDLAFVNRTFEEISSGRSQSFRIEYRIKNAAGEYRWVRDSGKVFRCNEKGHPQRLIGLIYDVTEQVETAEKAKRYTESLEKFAHITSHKLRLPVANLIGLSSLLLEEDINAVEKENLLHTLHTSALDLDEVIREMTEAISFGNSRFKKEGPSAIDSIWFIDDDHINNLLSERLMKKHFPEKKWMVFQSAEEAIALLKNNQAKMPDAIFLDINMPTMDGWGFLEYLTQNQLSVNVYMLTSSIDPKDQEKALKYSQVRDFISKPLKEERLRLIIR